MRPECAFVPVRPGSSYLSTTNNRPFSSNAIATGAVTNGSAATNSRRKPGLTRKAVGTLVAGADGTRGKALDEWSGSADRPEHESKQEAAKTRTVAQRGLPSLRCELLMCGTSSNSSSQERENTLNRSGVILTLARNETRRTGAHKRPGHPFRLSRLSSLDPQLSTFSVLTSPIPAWFGSSRAVGGCAGMQDQRRRLGPGADH